MPTIQVLVEVSQSVHEAFARFEAARGPAEAVAQSESYLGGLAGLQLSLAGETPPVPLFSGSQVQTFAAFATPETGPDAPAASVVVACEIDAARVGELATRANVRVWPNSVMAAFPAGPACGCDRGGCAAGRMAALAEIGADPCDLARTAATHVDCWPFRPAVEIDVIRQLLAVEAIWQAGFRGQNVIVGIVDAGVNSFYPVVGGFERPGGPRPGAASIQSHGSMCAADVLVAAPFARLYDYPFLAGPQAGSSGVALQMFQAILDQRRIDGTPQLTSNSYGFYALPPRAQFPNHEAYDADHPLNRKVREVVASGAACFFAAGNCGSNCPSGQCQSSAIGPSKSIAASNSLPETIAIAAVNSRHERIGYSAQGPGTLHAHKPDLSAYSHFFGNFGPGRPAGGSDEDYDNGTSAACPVAAGVAALLLSAFDDLTPDDLREGLVATAINLGLPGWDDHTGHGVVNAGAAYHWIRERRQPSSAVLRRPAGRRR